MKQFLGFLSRVSAYLLDSRLMNLIAICIEELLYCDPFFDGSLVQFNERLTSAFFELSGDPNRMIHFTDQLIERTRSLNQIKSATRFNDLLLNIE